MQSLEPNKRQVQSVQIQILFLMIQKDWRLFSKRLLIRAVGRNGFQFWRLTVKKEVIGMEMCTP
jgi:hypothetical protein